MKLHKLLIVSLGLCVAGTALAQDQNREPKAAASAKLRKSDSARAAAGLKDTQQQDAQARRERAEKVAAGLQKKTNETASAAASNVK